MSGNNKGGNKFVGGLFNKKPERSKDLEKKAAAAQAQAERLKAQQEETDALEKRQLEQLEQKAAALKARLAEKKKDLINKEGEKTQESIETSAAAAKRLAEEKIELARGRVAMAEQEIVRLNTGKNGKNDLESRIANLQQALLKNSNDIKKAENSLATERKALNSLINPTKIDTAPLSEVATKRKSSESSSTTEPRKSDMSSSSHGSTSGLKVAPPPVPRRPALESGRSVLEIEGLGTVFTEKGGKQQLAFKGNPNEKFDLIVNNSDYVSVVISDVEYGFTKEDASDKWDAFIMKNGEWEAIENNFVEEPKSRSRGPSMGSHHDEDVL